MLSKLSLVIFLSICVYISTGFTKRDCNKNLQGLVTCRATLRAFTWNNGEKRCVEAIYGGCNPTPNNFATLLDCERIAKPICEPYYTDYAEDYANAFSEEDCNHEVHLSNPFPCSRHKYKVWKWSNKQQACIKKIYYGCNGSGNRFYSWEECDRIARPVCGDFWA